MRLTGADISSDTGCWQAAAFHRCTQLSGSLVDGGSPMSACLSAITQLTHGCKASTLAVLGFNGYLAQIRLPSALLAAIE